jgi:hypothetical protein
MFLAKPNLNNSDNQKVFNTESEAIAYLEKMTGHEMDFEVKRRRDPVTGKMKVIEKISDWYLVNKLERV